jgi:hypothetical protein
MNLTTRNDAFQPRATLHPAVIQPAQAKVIGRKARLTSQGAQQITPVWRTPAQIKMGRAAFNQPGHAAVRPAVSQLATGN